MKKETRDRILFGVPLGFGGFYLTSTPLRFIFALVFYFGVLVELESLSRRFMGSFEWKKQHAKGYLQFLE